MGYSAEPSVARCVPKLIVGRLEVVNIDEREHEALARAPCPVQLMLEGVHASRAAKGASQIVGIRARQLGVSVAAVHLSVLTIQRCAVSVAGRTRPVDLGLLPVESRPVSVLSLIHI